MKQFRIKGVILDLDGTLLDSMQLWHEIDIQFLTENGIEPPEGISDIVSKMSIAEWADYFIREFRMPHTPEQVIRRIEELAYDAYANTIPLKPYVREFLNHWNAQKIPMGVATATYRSSAYAALERLNIAEDMQFILTSEEIPAGKTRPDIFLEAARLLGTRPEETLVVEDSLHCVETAADAGFLTAGVYDSAVTPENWKKMQKRCTITAQNLRELCSLL